MKTLMIAGILLLVGCASDPRPMYIDPKGRSSDLAVLKGASGTYIHEIDGAPVENAKVVMYNWGGNSVSITPGTHVLLVTVHSDAGGQWSPSNVECRFNFICEKGHTYEFTRRNMSNAKLKVIDKNSGKSLDIDDQGGQ